MKKEKINKVVLAYSGGLDTSIILRWLQKEYDCEVIAFMADLGQGEELESAAQKARDLDAGEVVVEDLRDTFTTDYVWPMMRANALYEGEYLLGTSIARPLIAARQVAAAKKFGADALAHGATGKGNDQIRMELGYYALAPKIKVIAPWRIWDLNSRAALIEYAKANGVKLPDTPAGKKSPYSMDANLLHISYEGGELEDPNLAPEKDMWLRTVSAQDAPDKALEVEIEFKHGDPVAIDGVKLQGAKMLEKLNELAGSNAIGRVDLVENRFIGMKSRGCYETPGGTLLFKTRRALESITLDREVMRLRDDLMPRYASLVYQGLWFSPERELLQGMFDDSSKWVTGKVTCVLYKGTITIVKRSSANSLHDENVATFEDDQGSYDQFDAQGFIKLVALRLQLSARRENEVEDHN